MELRELKKQLIEKELGITVDFGRILAVLDFGNVNFWFESDRQDADGQALADNEKLVIDLAALKEFASLFATDVRFYYGHDPQNTGSLGFITAAKHIFGKARVFTKPIQKIKHYLAPDELSGNKRVITVDHRGQFVRIHKCNFDVEISVDSIRLEKNYDTLALFSSDADFMSLARHLRRIGKQIILVKGGYITSDLRKQVDVLVNAQDVKRHITKKQRPGR